MKVQMGKLPLLTVTSHTPRAQFLSVYNKEAFTDDAGPFLVNREQVINFAFNLIYNWTEAKFLYSVCALVWCLSGLFGCLRVNREAGVQTITQRAKLESELCRSPFVSVSWQRTGTQLRANKLHHPDPTATALLCGRVVSRSWILLENHRWKGCYVRNVVNLWRCPLWMMCYSSAHGWHLVNKHNYCQHGHEVISEDKTDEPFPLVLQSTKTISQNLHSAAGSLSHWITLCFLNLLQCLWTSSN